MNELLRELVEALEYSSDFLSRSASRFDDVHERRKARAYLETGGWTRVEDGLPVVPDGEKRVAIYVVSNGLVLRTYTKTLGLLVGVTHWRYADQTPETPKG